MKSFLRFFALVLVLATAACSVGPAPETDPILSAADAPLDATLPLATELRHGYLDNGLRYLIRENRKPEGRAEIWLAVNAGSVQEDDDQRGLAHFVEHMAFNGTERFQRQELVDYLERIGMRFGPDVNAFTSFDETVYMLRVPTDDEEIVLQAFRILEDWASAIVFEPEEVDKERGVVIEEWRLGRGAQARVRDRQFPILFQGSRYAERLPIGTVETLRTAPTEALIRYWRDWYRPDLMTVIAVGDFDGENVEGLIRQHFEGLESPDAPRERIGAEVPDHDETLFSIETDPELTGTIVGVLHKLPKEEPGTVAAYRKSLLEGLGTNMVNARLDEIRRGPSPPFLAAATSSGGFVRTIDIAAVQARVDPESVEAGTRALLEEVARAGQHGFNPGELERAKADLLRGYERAYRERDQTDSGTLAGELMRHTLEDEAVPGIEYELGLAKRFVPEISLEEVNAWAAERAEGSRVVLISSPESTADSLPDEEELAALLDEAELAELEPWIDRTRDEPLVETAPEPGAIVEDTTIDELGVTEWRLSNGIRVILKPTEFRDDQVLLSGFSAGGHSLVSDEDWASAAVADQVIPAGGLGSFDLTELEKALAGSTVRIGVTIDELEEGISGSASPDDLELLFQLAYLSVTAPRKDTEAYDSMIERATASLQHRLANPDAVFSDAMSVALASGHHRRRPPSVELLGETDLDRSFEIYQDRFADVGDMTVVLVGNFDVEAVRPLVETWVASLPTTEREESWRDVGVERPDGPLEVNVAKGVEPKSRTQISFGGPAEWSRRNVYTIQSLSNALRIRLREVLREDLGGTYGVRVSAGLSRWPESRYSLTVSFSSDPDRAGELREQLFAELARLRDEGFGEDIVGKVQEIQRRERETALQENGFWLGALETAYRHGLDPRDILRFDELVDSLDEETLQSEAERYVDLEDYVAGTLMPETATQETATQ